MPSINWDQSLIEELASRRCIIFMGAGASAGSQSSDGVKHPPNWEELLKLLLNSIPPSDDKEIAKKMINEGKFLEAAEVICSNINQADLSTIFRKEFITPKYKPSEIHKSILKIDPKIVITTNYDDIYQKYCSSGDAIDGYNTCIYYDTHLINDLRSPVRSIIKAHGCISDISKAVLTKHQYFKARQESPNFFKVLDALFITHTLLFIGYSLTDPDIQLLLENTNITAPSAHPHYAIIKKDTIHNSLKAAATKSYNLRFIEYDGPDHSNLLSGLNDLADLVIEKREANPTAI